jgi:poly [ADP-ribose] polymerase
MPIAVRKLKKEDSYPVDGYTETTKHVILMCGNVDGNANKFYVLELQHNPDDDDYRLYSEYGRIGRENPARDLRENLSLYEAEKEFERIKKSKLKKKTKTRKLKDGDDKHAEQYREVDIAAPTIGSPNIRAKSGANGGSTVTTTKRSGGSAIGAIFGQMGYQPSVQTLLGQLLAENIHNIEATSNVTVTHNGLETPLGPITHSHIGTARDTLNRLQAFSGSGKNNVRDDTNRTVRDLNSEFFSLVPHKFGRQITVADMLLSDDDIAEKLDLLQGMEAALSVTIADDDDKNDGPKLPLSMGELSRNSGVYKAIHNKVTSTAKHHDVRSWSISRIFETENAKELARYRNPDPNGPEYDLFHGSANSNLLSIMLNGFYVPPSSASHVTGRMFGNGVYGASSSSKSFRYSAGLWGGQRSRMQTAYMFVVKFGMGRVYETYDTMYRGAPKGYHSIHAKAGRTLMNDEFIVYDPRQARITHLIEMSK